MNHSSLTDFSNALADAAARAGNWTVMVDARQRLPASGVLLSDDQVLTANHVVERDEDIFVTLADGLRLPARLAGRDRGSDLALLRLEQAAPSAAEFALDEPRIGQIALALGRPSSEGLQASLGVISLIGGPARTGRDARLERYFRTDAIPLPGFSGGPLINTDGSILGVNTSGFGADTIITIPARTAQKIALALLQNGHIRRGRLGIRSQQVELSPAFQQALGREQSGGLLLVGLESDSPAAQAGLVVGDILVGIADHSVRDHDDLMDYLHSEVVGKATPLMILRGGQPLTLTVVIGSN